MEEPTPLFKPGFHDVSMEILSNFCVSPFPGNERRQWLFSKLSYYLEQLHKVGPKFEVWIDGSFITSKQTPSDIDIVIWCNGQELDSLPLDKQELLLALVKHRHIIKHRYGLDVYIETLDGADLVEQRSYWRGLYCFVKETEAPKGVPRIAVGGNYEPNSMA